MIEQRAKELERASRNDTSILEREELLGLMAAEEWTVRMHLCRMISRVRWPAEELGEVQHFLFKQAADENTFVRAWALDALASLACLDESIRSRVIGMIEEALESGPPSIRVRAREGSKRLNQNG